MREDFLHYIWKSLYYRSDDLITVDSNLKINVQKPGYHNSDQGPDFLEAAIEIDGIQWNGAVEIHIKSSDWYAHGHQHDKNYDKVILHVVWEADRQVGRTDGTHIPQLVLKNIIWEGVKEQFDKLQYSQSKIPCEGHLQNIDAIFWQMAKDNALNSRLNRKAVVFEQCLKQFNKDWRQVSLFALVNYLGLNLNKEAFARLGNSLSVNIIQKYTDQPLMLEAYLFGQAGFLNGDRKDDYFNELKGHYAFLKKKYTLEDQQAQFYGWKLSRTRPANYPTYRLAHLAGILNKHPDFFQRFTEYEDSEQLRDMFKAGTSDYWRKHYFFGEKAKVPSKSLGDSSIDIILINSLAPLLFLKSKYYDSFTYREKALNLLENLPAEDNKITRLFKNMGLEVKTAADSQSLIELYNEYCTEKKCAECAVGQSILKEAAGPYL